MYEGATQVHFISAGAANLKASWTSSVLPMKAPLLIAHSGVYCHFAILIQLVAQMYSMCYIWQSLHTEQQRAGFKECLALGRIVVSA